MNALANEWSQKARGDLNTAKRELRARRDPNYDSACFHSQQCAEKYLKAFLLRKGQEPPRTHNLVELLRLCRESDPTLELVRADVESLNGYGVVIRYPGVTATKGDAKQALKAAERVQKFMEQKLE